MVLSSVAASNSKLNSASHLVVPALTAALIPRQEHSKQLEDATIALKNRKLRKTLVNKLDKFLVLNGVDEKTAQKVKKNAKFGVSDLRELSTRARITYLPKVTTGMFHVLDAFNNELQVLESNACEDTFGIPKDYGVTMRNGFLDAIIANLKAVCGNEAAVKSLGRGITLPNDLRKVYGDFFGKITSRMSDLETQQSATSVLMGPSLIATGKAQRSATLTKQPWFERAVSDIPGSFEDVITNVTETVDKKNKKDRIFSARDSKWNRALASLLVEAKKVRSGKTPFQESATFNAVNKLCKRSASYRRKHRNECRTAAAIKLLSNTIEKVLNPNCPELQSRITVAHKQSVVPHVQKKILASIVKQITERTAVHEGVKRPILTPFIRLNAGSRECAFEKISKRFETLELVKNPSAIPEETIEKLLKAGSKACAIFAVKNFSKVYDSNTCSFKPDAFLTIKPINRSTTNSQEFNASTIPVEVQRLSDDSDTAAMYIPAFAYLARRGILEFLRQFTHTVDIKDSNQITMLNKIGETIRTHQEGEIEAALATAFAH